MRDALATGEYNRMPRIWAMAASLFLTALATRLAIWGWSADGAAANLALMARILREDALVIGGFAGAAFIVQAWLRRVTTLRYLIYAAYLILGMMMVFNVLAINLIGGPVKMALIAQADWFRSLTPLSAVGHAATFTNVAVLVASLAGLVAAPRLLAPPIRILTKRRWMRAGLFGCFALLIAGFWFVAPVSEPTRSVARAVNPSAAFARSVWSGTPLDVTGIEPARSIEGPPFPAIALRDAPPPKNVVIIVLESIGADVAYGQSPVKSAGLMPNLRSAGRQGAVFSEIYTPVSASTISGTTILSGRFPGYPPAQRVDGLPRDTLPVRLAGEGWDNAFFMSGDLEFQDFGKYLRERKFAALEDMTHRGCAADGTIDDLCTAAAFDKWFDGGEAEKRFAVIWSGQAHYPYYDEDMSGTSPAQVLARYERTVQRSDAMIGQIVQTLRERDALDDTLLIITGDHGEAFDEHGFQLHANSAYVEEVRVPLVMRHASIPPETRVARAGSTVDISAMIWALLGCEESFGQGINLLAAGTERPAFSAVFGDRPMLGYRVGGTSVLLDLSSGEVTRFDRLADPFEMKPEILKGAEEQAALAVFSRLARDSGGTD